MFALFTDSDSWEDGRFPECPGLPMNQENRQQALSALTDRLAEEFRQIPLTDQLPPGTNPCGTAEALSAARSSSAPDAILMGIRTAAQHTTQAESLVIPSLLQADEVAALLIRKGWLLECVIQPALQSAFPTASIQYYPETETLRATSPPTIRRVGDARISSLDVEVNSEGQLLISLHVEEEGFCYTADAYVTVPFAPVCGESGDGLTEIRLLPPEPLPEPDVEAHIDFLCAFWLMAFGGLIGLAVALIIDAIAHSGGEAAEEAAESVVRGPLNVFGPLTLPLPRVATGLVVDRCRLDDWLLAGRLQYRDIAPTSARGAVVLETGQGFDLDHGVVGPLEGAPVGVDYDLARQAGQSFALVTLGSARIGLANKPFPELTLGDLSRVSFDFTSVLSPFTFGVRTSERRFAKCRVWNSPTGLHVEYVTYDLPRANAEVREVFARRIEEIRRTGETRDTFGIGRLFGTAQIPVDFAWEARYVVEGWNLVWPLTYSWRLAGMPLHEGTTTVNLGAREDAPPSRREPGLLAGSYGELTAEVNGGSVRIMTVPGTNVHYEPLELQVVDADNRSVTARRTIKLPGRTIVTEVETNRLRDALLGEREVRGLRQEGVTPLLEAAVSPRGPIDLITLLMSGAAQKAVQPPRSVSADVASSLNRLSGPAAGLSVDSRRFDGELEKSLRDSGYDLDID